MKRVVVTGMGALTPIGNNLPDFQAALLAGRSGAAPITRFDAGLFKTRFACELKGFDPLRYMEKADMRKHDPFAQYALVAVQEAINHAHINFEVLNKNRIGVIWGSGNGGMTTFEEQVTEFMQGGGIPRFNPFFSAKVLLDIAAGIISIKYGLRGPNFTTVSACATSNTAIIDAFNYIRWGKADMIITGGSEAPIIKASIGGFNAARALSTHNENPAVASRPFDVARDGFVMGEGAGALILESLEHAVERRAPILAEVAGGGMAADAYHLTSAHPEGEGAYLGMLAALEDAGIGPEQIDYLNAHATSTPTGDISELNAIGRVFGPHVQRLPVSATKSMTGHLLGAAGAVEAIICILAVRDNIIPPTINTKTIEPAYAGRFNIITGEAIKADVAYAMSNTFGFGGHTATSIFKKFTGS